MKKLSKEAESNILTALNAVADSVNNGDHPDAAIVKAANEHEIPSGQVNLMVTAYNTGRTSKQRTAAESPFDKAAEFELANPHKIMEKLYPTHVKTAAQSYNETVVDDEYTLSPHFAQRKQASDNAARNLNWKMVDKPADLPRDEVTPVKRAFHQNKFDSGRYEACRGELARVRDVLSGNFEKLGNYFRTPGSISFSSVVETAELQHGGIGRAVLSQVSRILPDNVKQASDRVPPLVKVDQQALPWSLVAECVKLASALHANEQKFQQLSQHVAKSAEARLRPFVQGQSKSVVASLSSHGIEKSAIGGVGALALTNMLRGMGGDTASAIQTESDEQVSDYLEALDDPIHNEELRKIKIRAQLEDMIANDPVISEFNPEDVVFAYNELVEISPRSADQLMLMRSLLRKHLQSGGDMDPYDIQQNIMGAEEGLRKRDEGIDAPFAPGSLMSGSDRPRGYAPGPGGAGDRAGAEIQNLKGSGKKLLFGDRDSKKSKPPEPPSSSGDWGAV